MAEKIPLPRDENRFKYLSEEPMPVIPEGASLSFEGRTTLELIQERQQWLADTICCPTCAGHGRVPKEG